MTHSSNNNEPKKTIDIKGDARLGRRELLKGGIALAGALGMGVGLDALSAAGASAAEPGSTPAPTPAAEPSHAPLDAAAEAKKIAFDRIGNGEPVLLISGFPQTRLSWSRLTPLLSQKFEAIPADLPSFGDSGILSAPATTENVGRIFHEFVATLGAPLHVVAHDFGAWCAYSWALLFPGDFKSLTLMEAGIPGVTLTNDVQVSDYKRKWQFIFQMLPELPAELTRGKEDIYVGWWYKNKVHNPGAVPPDTVAAYVKAYARDGRMDAAFDYCRRILDDMDFNKKHFKNKIPVRLLAIGGQYSIPNMGEFLRPYFQEVKSVTIPDSGHFVPEEQPEALAKELMAFL
jgi:pimeloyl-ACP methyl ester carboxylesterase